MEEKNKEHKGQDTRENKRPRRGGFTREVPEYEQRIIDLARVTRVMAGGKRMRFRACVAIGNKKGEVGIGLAKGADVTLAVNKAVNKAKKSLITIPLIKDTIPHIVVIHDKAVNILLKPAPQGTGIKAGGAVRVIFEIAGVPNIVAKILGTNNKINNVKALIKALKTFKVGVKKQGFKEVVLEKEEIKKATKEIKK